MIRVGFTHALRVKFIDMQCCEDYMKHPMHKNFVKMLPFDNDAGPPVAAIDYEVTSYIVTRVFRFSPIVKRVDIEYFRIVA